MAAPTYSDVLTFSRSVGKVSKAASREFASRLKDVDFSDWTVAAKQLKAIVEAIASKYGIASAELGAQWYEYCRRLGIGSGYTALVADVDRAAVNGSANQQIDKLFAGSVTATELGTLLSTVVENTVTEQARNTVLSNLEGEYKSAVRSGDRSFARKCGYSRVTTGSPCAFCSMLASQGFVYRSERSALETKSGDKYHDNCSCVAVPFSRSDEISGYEDKLAEHESKYREADNLRRSGKYPDDLASRIEAAKRNHDGKWTSTNETLVIMRYQNEDMA